MTIQPKPADDVDSVGEKTENYEIPEAYTEILDAYAKLFLETGETRPPFVFCCFFGQIPVYYR